jgi:hypothetical protein
MNKDAKELEDAGNKTRTHRLLLDAPSKQAHLSRDWGTIHKHGVGDPWHNKIIVDVHDVDAVRGQTETFGPPQWTR